MSDTLFIIRLIIGVLMTVVLLGIAGRRLAFLYRLGASGQPLEPDRLQAGGGVAGMVRAELAEVAGQRKLLQWTVPGLAHFAVFWGFVVLLLTVIEGFGALFNPYFQIPVIGNFAALGVLEDLFALLCVAAIVAFTVIRIREAPKNQGRSSRFFGSHLGPAWFVLFMIFNVVWTLIFARGAQINALEVNETPGRMNYLKGAFASQWVADLFAPLGKGVNEVLETLLLLVALAVLLGFTVFVTYSKHLHILLSLPNVALARRPRALGAAKPVYSQGVLVDFEDPGDDDLMGVGTIEDFTWKGLLDFGTCTECGRCQSQCPAWNTGKPLSPKLLMMGLRDHALARAPYTLATAEQRDDPAYLPEDQRRFAEVALVGDTGYDPADPAHTAYLATGPSAVIDADVLWSCTTCGACVEQCPVDIEHVDHIIDMRRHQMLVESAFPEEAGDMLRGLEHAGDPWNRGSRMRLEWAAQLDFEVPVFGADGTEVDGKLAPDIEYLFWVGCAGALDDTAQRTTRAVATLLHQAGVKYVVLGEMESCTGDPARRIGHEFLYQMLAAQNIETLTEIGARRLVVTCAHCLNTLANEYAQLGAHYEVIHHTALLATLVADGRLTPVTRVDEAVTYHDPCYLGRHNRIFSPPREVIGAIPGVRFTELPRSRERSFCCGAGGARMFMDENLGTRINLNRSDEALTTLADGGSGAGGAGGGGIVTAGCPFCLTMLGDGVSQRQLEGTGSGVRVLDVAELLLEAVTPAAAAPETRT